MKKLLLILTTISVVLICSCGSDRQTDHNNDSLMTDSAVIDSATISNDTIAVGADKLSTDSTTLNP